ncbi:hypothetical protein [Luteimonas sp. SDU101]|uniref:hypothetical protein n=1 Tax=Luteimonas sp. SDU101 TaxID=3422593 RepID=UPI003EB83CA8
MDYATEVEATAWANAALVHLQLDPAVLFHGGGYQGASDRLILMFSLGVYPGAFGLAQAGMTTIGDTAPAGCATRYPRMSRWLRA